MAACVGVKPIHRQVSTLSVCFPIGAEGNLGSTPIGSNVHAKRRDFERLSIDDQRNRSVRDSGRHAFDARSQSQLRHRFR